jgi:hypothetical protein
MMFVAARTSGFTEALSAVEGKVEQANLARDFRVQGASSARIITDTASRLRHRKIAAIHGRAEATVEERPLKAGRKHVEERPFMAAFGQQKKSSELQLDAEGGPPRQ